MLLTVNKIYVSFEREERFYRGSLSPVSGAASYSSDSYHLMINGYYYGHLRRTATGWAFDNCWNWDDLAPELGREVEAHLLKKNS